MDSRQDFNETWLSEEPEGVQPTNLMPDILDGIKAAKNRGSIIINLGNNYYKIEGNTLVFYWYEENNNILLAAEFSKKAQALEVNGVNKLVKGQPPYAADLYDIVINDRKNNGVINSIVLKSDNRMTQDGLKIWDELIKRGHTISVYDVNKATQITQIHNSTELQQYFKMGDKSYQNYRYVISESGPNYGEVEGIFILRRMRENAGIL